jgi:YVTN family beta-propeller protein
MPTVTRRTLAAALGGAALLPMLPIGANAASCAGTVFTANERGGTISAIDLATGRVSSVRIPIAPHNVDGAAGGRLLLAVGADEAGHRGGRHAGDPGRVIILEPVQGSAPRIVAAVPAGQHPAHVVADRAGQHALLTDSGANALLIVGIDDRRVLSTVRTGAYPHGLRLSPDGREAWIANVKDNTVSVVDVAAAREETRLVVGPSPVQVGFLPDGSRVFVSLRGANAVAEIDTAARRVVRRIPVGPGPVQVFATPDGRFVYVANEGTRAAPGTNASVIDVAAGRVIATIETGRGAHGVVVCADGSRAFVTNLFDDTVAEIDVATQTVLRRFRVGRAPNGITWIPG